VPLRPCLVCNALSDGSYCPRHRPARTGRPRPGSGGKAATFRRRTLAKTAGRCAIPSCKTPLWDVMAHHVHAIADGGDIDGPGIALCRAHHALAHA
jgi:hypothetical protein